MLINLLIGVVSFALIVGILYVLGRLCGHGIYGFSVCGPISWVEYILAGVVVVAFVLLILFLTLAGLSFLGSLIKVLIFGG